MYMVKEFKFRAFPSGDHEAFCFDVDRETFIKIKGNAPEVRDASCYRKGKFRIYPGDIFDSKNELKIKIKVE